MAGASLCDSKSIFRLKKKCQGERGETHWLGPTLGAHNEEVYGQLLGFTPERLEQLKQGGVI